MFHPCLLYTIIHYTDRKYSDILLIHKKWPPTWDERVAKHGIEAFRDNNLFSCKLWLINWPTYVEIIGHLKALSLKRQFPDC